MPNRTTLENILDSSDDNIYDITTNAAGPNGIPVALDYHNFLEGL
jgi:hypothetical protein